MKKILFGCGALLLVAAILGGVLILETPRFLEAGKTLVKNVVAEEARISALEAAWRPPSPKPDDRWFPAEVGEWKREKSEPAEAVTAIGLTRRGHGATYSSNRGMVEVHVVPVAESERATVLQHAQEALRSRYEIARLSKEAGVSMSVNRESARLTTTRGNRTYVRIGSTDHTRFWWVQGYLFIFRSYGSADQEQFPEQFITSVRGPVELEQPPAK